jgi:hypothetical protein
LALAGLWPHRGYLSRRRLVGAPPRVGEQARYHGHGAAERDEAAAEIHERRQRAALPLQTQARRRPVARLVAPEARSNSPSRPCRVGEGRADKQS